MTILAVDTSGSHLTVVLLNDEKVTKKYVDNCGLQHSTTLMPIIEEVLNEGEITLNEIDVFACSVGPGSFTGIRIGVSTMKAFSYAYNKKVLKVTSFDILAYNKKSGKNLAVIDAKHGNYYVCGFDGVEVKTPYTFVDTQGLLSLKEEFPNILTASDIEFCSKNCDLQQGFIDAVKSLSVNATLNREELLPLYVRKSQAEEGL